MIETVVLDYLKAHGLKVFTEVPAKPPTEFYVLEKTGSSRTEHIFESTFALQAYGTSMLHAAQMSEDAKRILENLIALSSISRVSAIRDYNFTDPTTKKYRYQIVFTIIHY